MVNDFYYTSLLKGVYQSIISKHAFKKVIYFRSSFINLQGIYRIVVFTTTGKTTPAYIAGSPFFGKRCTSMFTLHIKSMVLYHLSYPIFSRSRNRTCADFVALPLSYPDSGSGRGVEPPTYELQRTYRHDCNSIQIVTTSALLCFFETLTWFACHQRLYPSSRWGSFSISWSGSNRK